MAMWLTDDGAHVRSFAESYVRLPDRRIAAEQRLVRRPMGDRVDSEFCD